MNHRTIDRPETPRVDGGNFRPSLLATLALALLLTASTAFAEVSVRLSSNPVQPESSRTAGSGVPTVKSSGPADSWAVPFTVDDTIDDGETTYIAIRNQSSIELEDVQATIRFYDEYFVLLSEQPMTLSRDQVRTLNVREAPGVFESNSIARGVAVIDADDLVSVDFFQLNTAENFATGRLGWINDDSCNHWMVRFLHFGGPGGTRINVLAKGPRGAADEDPPTLVGTVYDEAGEIINTFELRTDEWYFSIDATELTPGAFGSMEITISSIFGGGYVTAEHNAFGKFSVGVDGICWG